MLNLIQKPKANGTATREQILQHELEKQRHLLSQLAHVLCALLKEKHQGRAFVDKVSLEQTANWNAQVQFLSELGTVRLQLMTPDGKPFVAAEKPQEGAIQELSLYLGMPIEKMPAALGEAIQWAEQQKQRFAKSPEAAPSAPCASGWHKDGIGLRCPECGSIERTKE